MACYYHYCALLRRSYRGKTGRRCYYLLREDFSKFNRYRRQCDLLWEQRIESTEDLLTYKARLTHELEVLTQKRKYLYNHKEVLRRKSATGGWKNCLPGCGPCAGS